MGWCSIPGHLDNRTGKNRVCRKVSQVLFSIFRAEKVEWSKRFKALTDFTTILCIQLAIYCKSTHFLPGFLTPLYCSGFLFLTHLPFTTAALFAITTTTSECDLERLTLGQQNSQTSMHEMKDPLTHDRSNLNAQHIRGVAVVRTEISHRLKSHKGKINCLKIPRFPEKKMLMSAFERRKASMSYVWENIQLNSSGRLKNTSVFLPESWLNSPPCTILFNVFALILTACGRLFWVSLNKELLAKC